MTQPSLPLGVLEVKGQGRALYGQEAIIRFLQGKPSCENELANRNLMSQKTRRGRSHTSVLWRRVPGKTTQLTHPRQEDDQQGKNRQWWARTGRCTLHGSWRSNPWQLSQRPIITLNSCFPPTDMCSNNPSNFLFFLYNLIIPLLPWLDLPMAFAITCLS